MLNGIQNFLQFINDNWTSIVVIFSLVFLIVRRVISFLSKSDEEKIEIAKSQIQQAILKLITDAEVDYESWEKAGSIKRSQVIQKIFENYPILSKITDQESLVNWIDEMIDEALKILREIVAANNKSEE